MAMKQGELPALVPQIFEHEQFGKIRVVTIEGEIKFVGTDAATALGYTNPQKALRDHVPDKFKRGERIVTPGGVQSMTLIDEAGLYRLTFRSNLPEAEKFTDWACEIMVSVRKTGSYILPGAVSELDRERLEIEKLRLTTEQMRLDLERERLAVEKLRLTTEPMRLDLERERLEFDKQKFDTENSKMSKRLAKAQLLRDLASSSGNNQSVRDDLINLAVQLVINEDFLRD